MSYLAFVLVDVVLAIRCFALLMFMFKPYSTTDEEQYLCLPLGFALLARTPHSNLSVFPSLCQEGTIDVKDPCRDRMKIYRNLPLIISINSGEKVPLTHLQTKTNIPFSRLKGYFAELKELRLIDDENSLRVTEKGKQYLKEYEMVLDFMSRMGLTN